MSVTQVGTPGTVQIQSGSNTGSVTGAWSGTQPRNAGDYLVACVTAWGGTSASAISGPGGIWHQQVTITSGTNRQTVAIFAGVAAGSDAAPNFTASMTGTAANSRMSCELFELTGQDPTSPVVTAGTGDAASSPVTITSTGNVTRSGSYGIDCVNIGLNSVTTCTYTPDASWTAVYDQGSVSARAHSACDVYPGPPTSSTLSSGPSSTGTVNEMSGVLIVVQPPGAAAATILTQPPLGIAPGLYTTPSARFPQPWQGDLSLGIGPAGPFNITLPGPVTSLTGNAGPVIVNQWSASAAQPAAFGVNLPPGLQSTVIALNSSTSVGGGSGVPSAGNWLFCIAGWNQSGLDAATVAVNDDIRSFWRPGQVVTATWPGNVPSGTPAVSTASGATRAAIWYTANLARAPLDVYVAPDGVTAGMAVLVVEVGGLSPWDTATGTATGYAAGAESLTLTLPPV